MSSEGGPSDADAAAMRGSLFSFSASQMNPHGEAVALAIVASLVL